MNTAAQIAIGVVIAVLMAPALILMTIDGFTAAREAWSDLRRSSTETSES